MAKMSSDTYEILKTSVEVFEKTGNMDVLDEIKAIFANHSDDDDVHRLTRGLRL